jgi:ribosomal protein S6
MNSYETIVIFDHQLGEAVIKEASKKIQGQIAAAGGVNIVEAAWGRKEIPYIHNRVAPGYYICYTYESARSETIGELESLLRIAENVDKFQTHKTSVKSRKFKGNPKSKLAGDAEDDFGDLDLEY